MAVTCCACWDFSPDYPLEIFFQDLNEFMLYIAPLVFCVVLWKLLVTNRTTPRGDVTVLGLDASAPTYSPKQQALSFRRKNLANLVNPVDVDRTITELTRPG